MKANSILETIGNTPHIRINRLFGSDANVWIKAERANPGGIDQGPYLRWRWSRRPSATASSSPAARSSSRRSGNTGIGLAMVAAVKGYRIILVMPESMSIERRRLMLAYGATFDLTPKEGGMKSAIQRALDLVEQTPGGWMPQQFENPANIDVHVHHTAAGNSRRLS